MATFWRWMVVMVVQQCESTEYYFQIVQMVNPPNHPIIQYTQSSFLLNMREKADLSNDFWEDT